MLWNPSPLQTNTTDGDDDIDNVMESITATNKYTTDSDDDDIDNVMESITATNKHTMDSDDDDDIDNVNNAGDKEGRKCFI